MAAHFVVQSFSLLFGVISAPSLVVHGAAFDDPVGSVKERLLGSFCFPLSLANLSKT